MDANTTIVWCVALVGCTVGVLAFLRSTVPDEILRHKTRRLELEREIRLKELENHGWPPRNERNT